MSRTKIICTVGPACQDEHTLRAMLDAGMHIARVNFSHGTHRQHTATIEMLRRLAEERGTVVPIIGDLQGPKIRLGSVQGELELEDNAEIVLTTREVPGDLKEVHLPHPEIVRDVQPGQRLLVDDGKVGLEVTSKTDQDLRCVVVEGGVLSSKKGLSVPGANLRIDAVTKKDLEDARFAVSQNLDYLALSFVRTGHDVGVLSEFLSSLGSSIPIIVKIEKPEALTHFEEILAASDAVMIARGDLGVETPPEQVPFTQKRIISECRRAAKAVITATQMLDSMMEHPRPTRAEASDIANAILDGTSAVMLSGETAAGKYPVQSVAMMTRIAEFSESNIPHDEWIDENHHVRAANAAEAISQATVEIAHELGAKAIVTSTYSGLSARLVARHRPRTPIVAITPKAEVNRQMGLLWGVVPKLVPIYETTDEMIDASAKAVLKSGLARVGDTIVITAGVPPGAGQTTNIVEVHVIQE